MCGGDSTRTLQKQCSVSSISTASVLIAAYRGKKSIKNNRHKAIVGKQRSGKLLFIAYRSTALKVITIHIKVVMRTPVKFMIVIAFNLNIFSFYFSTY
jgi:hypothetical protein